MEELIEYINNRKEQLEAILELEIKNEQPSEIDEVLRISLRAKIKMCEELQRYHILQGY